MKLTFLGTSHGYAEKNRYTSSTLIEVGAHSYVLDAGAPLEYILVNREKSFDAIRGIFITHMHSDHVGALNTLVQPFLRYRTTTDPSASCRKQRASTLSYTGSAPCTRGKSCNGLYRCTQRQLGAMHAGGRARPENRGLPSDASRSDL